MVHFEEDSTTSSSQSTVELAQQMALTAKKDLLVKEYSGAAGESSSIGTQLQKLTSSQGITSHCTVMNMGSLTSIASNKVNDTVKQFADFSPEKAMNMLNTVYGRAEQSKIVRQQGKLITH